MMNDKTIVDLCLELIERYSPSSPLERRGCGWCGGLPHTERCLVGRMQKALKEPTVDLRCFQSSEEPVIGMYDISHTDGQPSVTLSLMTEDRTRRWYFSMGTDLARGFALTILHQTKKDAPVVHYGTPDLAWCGEGSGATSLHAQHVTCPLCLPFLERRR